MDNLRPTGLNVRVETREQTVIVSPDGDIDLTASPVLRQELQKVQKNHPARLVVDLGGVTYMDSSGVATLVEAMQVSRRQSSDMVICRLQERVQSIFEIARLDTVFRIEPTLDDALS